jgi:competence protein ComEC
MDDIRRKLAQIDRQLAGINLHEKIISTSPLLFVAAGLIAGIIIQDKFDLPVPVWLILLVLLTATVIIFFILRQASTYCRFVLAYLALLCFVCLGAVRLTDYHQPSAGDIRNYVTDERQLATIRGLIVTEPHINRYEDWKFAKFVPTDPSSSFYLVVDEVETVQGWTKANGTVQVLVDEPVFDLTIGDYIRMYCWLDRFKPPTNPGQFDTANYLAGRNVFIGATVNSRDAIELQTNRSAGIFTRLKTKLRQIASEALLSDLQPEDAGRGLLQALLLGYRRDIDSKTYQAFREMGLLHFISLSGLHLGILFMIIWWLCKTTGLMKPARAIVCMIALTVFLLIVPARAPTVRAAVIVYVFCLSFFFRRHPNPINTLSLAAIILLMVRPTQLFEAGWQLSFATVLGILMFTDKFSDFFQDNIEKLFRRKKSQQITSGQRTAKIIIDKVILLFSIGFAAWLGGAGILLYHFYAINPLTCIWTVLVFPLVAAILTLGFFKMILFFILPTLSFVLGYIIIFLSEVLIRIVIFIADLDISQILIGRVPLILILFYYGIILFAGFAYFRRPLVKRVISATAIIGIIISLGLVKWERMYRDNLILTCLDVGHGQAIMVQLPGRANILFDAGSMYRSDIGRRIVMPFMNYIGTNRIDAVVISHNDVDHINGIPEIVEYCEINRIYANDDFFDKADQWGTAAFLRECLNETGHKIERLEKNLTLSNEANITMLWPHKEINSDVQLSDNDKSLVSLIEFAGKKILLCSDIEKFAQNKLMRLYPELKVDVVFVPHHGSINTLEPDFLRYLNADILICSCGLSQYQNAGNISPNPPDNSHPVKIFYTYKDGAVTVSIDKKGTICSDIFRKTPGHLSRAD